MKGFRFLIKSSEINENFYLVETFSHHCMQFVRFLTVIIEEMGLVFLKFVWQSFTIIDWENSYEHCIICDEPFLEKVQFHSHVALKKSQLQSSEGWNYPGITSAECSCWCEPMESRRECGYNWSHHLPGPQKKGCLVKSSIPHVSCAIASWKTPGDSWLPAIKTVTAIFFWLFYL